MDEVQKNQPTQLATLAKEMREAQRKYFRTRNNEDLRKSIKCEQAVDLYIVDLHSSAKDPLPPPQTCMIIGYIV